MLSGDKERIERLSIEGQIIDYLQEFLMGLGRGFTFAGRQVRFTFEDKHYKVEFSFLISRVALYSLS